MSNSKKSENPLILITSFKTEKTLDMIILYLKTQEQQLSILLVVKNEKEKIIAEKYNIDCVFYDTIKCADEQKINLSRCKKYNTQYIILIDGNCLLLDNFIPKTIKIIKSSYDYVVSNKFFYLTDHQIYKAEINKTDNYLSSGRVFNTNIFDDLNWFYSDIIYSSDDLYYPIFFKEKYKGYILDECLILHLNKSINASQYIISKQLSDIFIDYKVSHNPLLKIISITDDNDHSVKLLTKKNIVKKFAYITSLNPETLSKNLVSQLQLNILPLLKYTCDIYQLSDLNNFPQKIYEKILIDGTALNPRSSAMDLLQIRDKLNYIKGEENYLITHDLHDWSYGYGDTTFYNNWNPILEITKSKILFKKFLREYNFKSLISIVDCPELSFFQTFLENTISNFHLTHHFIYTPYFNVENLNKRMTKTHNFLFYGWGGATYPFRTRLLHLVQRLTDEQPQVLIRHKMADKCTTGKALAEKISTSWLCIGCTSKYKYATRKYYEITNSGSVIIGDINNQIYSHIGHNMIIVRPEMKDLEILQIINYYLNNKLLLIFFNFKGRRQFNKYNDNNYIKNLVNILDKNYTNSKLSLAPTINPHYCLKTIDISNISSMVSNIKIQNISNTDKVNCINLKETKKLDLYINTFLDDGDYILQFNYEHDVNCSLECLDESIKKTLYFRHIIINNIYYLYFKIEKMHSYVIKFLLTSNEYIIKVRNILLKKIYI